MQSIYHMSAFQEQVSKLLQLLLVLLLLLAIRIPVFPDKERQWREAHAGDLATHDLACVSPIVVSQTEELPIHFTHFCSEPTDMRLTPGSLRITA